MCLLVIFIISADLKVENNLVWIEDPSVLQDFARASLGNPLRDDIEGHHPLEIIEYYMSEANVK